MKFLKIKLLNLAFFTLTFCIAAIPQASQAQKHTDQVHLFNDYLTDTPISSDNFLEPNIMIMKYEGATGLQFGSYGGFPINEQWEIDVVLSYIRVSYESSSRSGIIDPLILARYNISSKKQTQFSVGGGLDIPIGDWDVFHQGAGPDFLFFGAVRHTLEGGLILCGNLGLEAVMNYNDEYETDIDIGGGILYPSNDKLTIVGEIDFDPALIIGGIDYRLQSGGHLRLALVLPLEEESPDLTLMGSYLIFF